MKYIFPGILVGLFLAGCSKQNSYQAQGTLIGLDPALCGCCGGVILTIDNRSGSFRVDTLPLMTRQQLYNLDFPKRIEFNYRDINSCAGIGHLEVSTFIIH